MLMVNLTVSPTGLGDRWSTREARKGLFSGFPLLGKLRAQEYCKAPEKTLNDAHEKDLCRP
ncbi:predicted protein [Pseudomonas sp. Os17]|nr:predicted protein [Pseudomonas sp. Os17]BAQ82490.1 predicted protein [Pseudomonas sp. St29]